MAIGHGVFGVTNAAQVLADVPAAAKSVNILNPLGNPTVYVGGAGVTTATGRPIYAGDSLTIDTDAADEDVYIVSTENCNVRWLTV